MLRLPSGSALWFCEGDHRCLSHKTSSAATVVGPFLSLSLPPFSHSLVRSTCTRTCHGGLAAGMLHCCSLLPFTLVIRNPSSFIFIVWPMWVFEVKLLNRLKYAKLHLLLLLGRNPHQQDNWQSYCNAQMWCGTQVLKGCCIKILSYCLAATQQ